MAQIRQDEINKLSNSFDFLFNKKDIEHAFLCLNAVISLKTQKQSIFPFDKIPEVKQDLNELSSILSEIHETLKRGAPMQTSKKLIELKLETIALLQDFTIDDLKNSIETNIKSPI